MSVQVIQPTNEQGKNNKDSDNSPLLGLIHRDTIPSTPSIFYSVVAGDVVNTNPTYNIISINNIGAPSAFDSVELLDVVNTNHSCNIINIYKPSAPSACDSDKFGNVVNANSDCIDTTGEVVNTKPSRTKKTT